MPVKSLLDACADAAAFENALGCGNKLGLMGGHKGDTLLMLPATRTVLMLIF